MQISISVSLLGVQGCRHIKQYETTEVACRISSALLCQRVSAPSVFHTLHHQAAADRTLSAPAIEDAARTVATLSLVATRRACGVSVECKLTHD